MIGSEHSPKPRPYWHVDAKWVAGLLLIGMVSLTLLVYTLVQITAEETALDSLSLTIALMFSRHGLDDETEIAELRQELSADPAGSFQPFPGSSITIRETDLIGRSPREIRLNLFRQLAEAIYRQEAPGQPALANAPDSPTVPINEFGVLALFTRESHRTLQRILLVLVGVCGVLLIPLIFFSYRFGRLSSPGCVLLVAGLPGALLFTLVATTLKPTSTPPQSEEMGDMIGYLAANVLPPLVNMAARTHLIAVISGVGLMAMAVVGSLVWRRTHKGRPV